MGRHTHPKAHHPRQTHLLVDQKIISAWAVLKRVNLFYKSSCSSMSSAHFYIARTSNRLTLHGYRARPPICAQ